MADVVFRVTNPQARRLAVAPAIAAIAAELAGAAAGGVNSRTGTLAGGFSVKAGRDPGTSLAVITAPHYHKYVEYGTRKMRAQAPMGRAVAAARARYGG